MHGATMKIFNSLFGINRNMNLLWKNYFKLISWQYFPVLVLCRCVLVHFAFNCNRESPGHQSSCCHVMFNRGVTAFKGIQQVRFKLPIVEIWTTRCWSIWVIFHHLLRRRQPVVQYADCDGIYCSVCYTPQVANHHGTANHMNGQDQKSILTASHMLQACGHIFWNSHGK